MAGMVCVRVRVGCMCVCVCVYARRRVHVPVAGVGGSWGRLGQLGENSFLSHPFTPPDRSLCLELPATGTWETVGGNSEAREPAPKWSENPTECYGGAKGGALLGPA